MYDYDLIALECFFPKDMKKPKGIESLSLNFHVGQEEISALTEPVIVGDSLGRSADLGPFQIYIYPRATPVRGRIRIYSRRDGGEGEGYSHPHISREGYPCWGDGNRRLIDDIVAAKDWEALISTCVEFLRSYNPNGAYYHLFNESYCTLCEELVCPEDRQPCPVCGSGFCIGCGREVETGQHEGQCTFDTICYSCYDDEERECPECGYFVTEGHFCLHCIHYIHDECWEEHKKNRE